MQHVVVWKVIRRLGVEGCMLHRKPLAGASRLGLDLIRATLDIGHFACEEFITNNKQTQNSKDPAPRLLHLPSASDTGAGVLLSVLHDGRMPSPYVAPEYNIDTQHGGTDNLAINDSFFRRFLTLLALHTTAKFNSRDGLCVPISRSKIVKTGRRVHLTEGATLKYIAEKTSIPVPKVYCSFLHRNRAYIVMERIRGEELPRVWKGMSEQAVENIFSQLRKMLQELRALKPLPNTGVESCVGGSLYDSRIPRGNPRFGPFKTIQEFHIWLRRDLRPEDLKDHEEDQDWHDLQHMISKQDGPWSPPVFTHGDLNPFNVLVREGIVVGILDWEFSGWYPKYWEFTSAWFGNATRTEWQGMLDRILDRPRPDEFTMEEIRNKWWGE